MSAALTLLREFAARGIRVESGRPGMIRLPPKSRLTPELRERARQCKQDLLAYLRARQVTRWCEEHRIDAVIGAAILKEEHRIDAVIGAAILKIECEALTLGWTYERLWNPDFWPHSVEHPRGLASVLSPGDELGEITLDFIVIRKADGQQQRFMRLDG
jgi:hypothetical protein